MTTERIERLRAMARAWRRTGMPDEFELYLADKRIQQFIKRVGTPDTACEGRSYCVTREGRKLNG